MKNTIIILVLSVGIVGSFIPLICSGEERLPREYVLYSLFHDVTLLFPELREPHLASITPEGQKAWALGSMQIPVGDVLLKGDFDDDGAEDVALRVIAGNVQSILLAERSNDSKWLRRGIFPLEDKSSLSWTGEALEIGSQSYLVPFMDNWILRSGSLALYAYGYSDHDLHSVLIKFTYVGPQDMPFPGLFISSFYSLPKLAPFKDIQRKDLSFGNDELSLWCITLSSQHLRTFFRGLIQLADIDEAQKRAPGKPYLYHALSVVDTASPHRPNSVQALLTSKELHALFENIVVDFEPKAPDASSLLREYVVSVAGN